MKRLLRAGQIEDGVNRLAAEVSGHYAGQAVTIIGVLNGSIVLLADLIRRLDLPLRVGLVQASSYRGSATEPASLHVELGTMPDIQGRDVLLIDDICDTGKTLFKLIAAL